MRVDELDLPDGAAELMSQQGIEELHPPQAEALPRAVDGRSLVVAIPTASGKSLIGYLTALRRIAEGGRVLYIVPLRALATEKYEDFCGLSPLGVRTAYSIGDYDSPSSDMEDVDVLVATSERADSLLRHGNPWLDEVSLVIADEVHLINDPGRGPTLEVTLTKLRRKNPSLQVIALSATISNAAELADWLGAELVSSEWRPTPLKEGIYHDGEIVFTDNSRRTVDGGADAVWSLVEDSVREGGQCLVFVNSRRSTESLATKHSKLMGRIIDRSVVEEDSKGLLATEAEPTSLGRKLADCVANGIAFHHAGLSAAQRKGVERAFKEGHVKCIVATPTLAAGINLPARRVIIRDVMRYSNGGLVPIPVLEIKQMCGRAGRPRFDPYGEAVVVAKSENQRRIVLEEYLLNETEPIYSKLGTEPALRSHVLALFATGSAASREDCQAFFDSTFFAQQADVWSLREAVDNVMDSLIDEGMLFEDGAMGATFFGRRVSDLYIDPESAVRMRDALKDREDPTDLGLLHAVCATPDMLNMYLRRVDYDLMESVAAERGDELLLRPPDDPEEWDFHLSELKTATALEMWVTESSEERILEVFNMGPGDLRNKVDTARWLLYSMGELAKIFSKPTSRRIGELTTMVSYGVGRDLLPLVSVRGIGRARARVLYENGIRDVATLRSTPVERLQALPGIGPRLARSLATGSPVPTREEPEPADDTGGQTCLLDF